MNLGGLFILVAIAILVRMAGRRMAPLLLPPSRLLTIVAGTLGGWGGSYAGHALLPLVPQVAGIDIPMAVAGAFLASILVGLAPFLMVLVGRG
ncbi:MAG: hypothetical protein HYU86_03985 [Chloroflexi bacterium]|nr:hypothetical protein [Chloroflexota bacterium]